jgi:asparagine synthase (glutamine-hydrolysing)
MCGIVGIYDLESKYRIDKEVLVSMANTIAHRGPDEASYFIDRNLGFGFRRLSIIDLENGHQPFFNKDKSISLICNGEIYNYKELRNDLIKKGYTFKTSCDVEVILFLYIEFGVDFLNKLNGQFAFAIYDANKDLLFLVRDHFGICPLFYSIVDSVIVFGSEIKAILKHPLIRKEVCLTGLDQVFSFPGLVSPYTMFKGINSLKPGYCLIAEKGEVRTHEYWDLIYPEPNTINPKPESFYIEQLEELLIQSVKYRLNADVPVGFYLSGGLDSSLVGALMHKINPHNRYESFSICFPELVNDEINERKYQQLVAKHINSIHNEIPFNWQNIEKGLKQAIFYSESPLKETYNTCSLALSESVNKKNIKVILSGEGADEFLAGYVGYRFDTQRSPGGFQKDISDYLEDEVRMKLWGDPDFFYEKNQYEFKEVKESLYSDRVNSNYQNFDCIERLGIDKTKLKGRSYFQKRSYLDLKLRLSDHLISDHCDRVCYANSIEGRYPFLDINLVNFVKTIPDKFKLNGLVEKYILKEVGKKYLPASICTRQKFGFVAPGSPQLLQNNILWVNDLLSYDRIKRQGYFNPDTVERLKNLYKRENFKLNIPYESDLLIVVLTFNILLQVFDMPNL